MEFKNTKTLITLTKSEKEKAKKISTEVFGYSNYSGLYAWFLKNHKTEKK